MQITDSFRNVGLIGRPGANHQVAETLAALVAYLDRKNITVVLDETTSPQLATDGHQRATRKIMGETCDLVIVVGGDGCLLGAARDLARYKVPLLGVNRGRLGFLTDIMPGEIEARMDEVLAGEYTVEHRFLLEAQIKRDGKMMGENAALNDVVFHSGSSVKMLEFELYIDGDFVYRQRSDGLIMSTPTGSTAYALSGGGPIMHPRLDAIVLVPMFPHTLSSRPIVIDGNSEIKVYVSSANDFKPLLNCDGQGGLVVEPGDWLYVRKRSHPLMLLHPKTHSFYEACRSKLGWSEIL
ncbi:MAG: NAD(+) kinase [Pseudomonadota bacterium]|nr:NAD(+) kinase [Pseudomonadales bacterium]MDY6921396.1 NAD(+) kinase [Pseudomonadota bacterium]